MGIGFVAVTGAPVAPAPVHGTNRSGTTHASKSRLTQIATESRSAMLPDEAGVELTGRPWSGVLFPLGHGPTAASPER